MSLDKRTLNLKVFFAAVIFWIGVCFVFWYLIHDSIIQPAILLAKLPLEILLPDVFSEFKLNSGNLILLTKLGENNGVVMPAAQAGNQIAYQINPKIFSYSLPFATALLLASSKEGTFLKIVISLTILYPFIVIGIIFQALKELILGNRMMHEYFISESSISSFTEVIAIGYQFNTLLIPALLPIILWGWFEREALPLRKDIDCGAKA